MAKVKILIITPHFYPENFKCNDMAFELYRRGFDVSVMTPIPDYPKGRFYDGYGVFRKRRETLNGVKIHRSMIIPRGNGSAFRLALNYVSYTFFAVLKALWFGLTKKYDVIVVHEPSPVMVGIPAVIIKKLQKIKIHFWVLDLWPESLQAAGNISNKFILGVFNKITKWIYKNCDTILIGSKGYRLSINSKGNFDYKIQFFPNWIDNIPDCYPHNVPDFPPGFNVLIAGNIGDAQDIPHVLDAVLALKGSGINFIFVGDGRKQNVIHEFSKKHNLENQIYCLGRFPVEKMPYLFSQADILFMALKNVPIFALTVPSRLQAYMASGKPIVAMINGEGAEVIKEAQCGWTVPAESSAELSDLLLHISSLDKSILLMKGDNGKIYSNKHYEFHKCMDHLCAIINKI